MGSNGVKFYQSQEEGTNKGLDGIIASDAVVMIKINSQWKERGGTNTDLIESIIEAILNHPDGFIGEIVIVDNGQLQYGSLPGGGGSFDWGDYNNAQDHSQSIKDIVNSFKLTYDVSIYNWQNITEGHVVDEFIDGDNNDGYVELTDKIYEGSSTTYVTYPKFTTKYGTKISFKEGIWDGSEYSDEKLVLLNVPVLKSHSSNGVTGCVKNYMGIHSDKTSTAHPYVPYGAMGTLMANTRMPDLNILDCIYVNANPKNYGPYTSYAQATELDIILASTDPVALDYWASQNVLMQTAELLGYPEDEINYLNPDWESPPGWQHSPYWLTYVCDILNEAGIETVKNDESINVHIYGAQRTTLEIREGWNLIGINWIPSSSNIDTIFNSHMDKIHSIYTYDEATQIYKMWINGIDKPDALSELECGKGYWVKATNEFTIDIPGNGGSEKQFDSGWNLVGLIGDTPETPESYLADTNWLQVSCYNTELDVWIDHDSVFGGEILVSPGIGYWVEIE